MSKSAAFSTVLHKEISKTLLGRRGEEELCFALWAPSEGASRTTALLERAIWPKSGERNLHGNVSFEPAYVERCIGIASAADRGLALLHSHIGPGWQGLSDDDFAAEARLAGAVQAATGLPLVGLTLGTDEAWSARFWGRVGPRRYEPEWCESVRVVGDRLGVTFADHLTPVPGFRPELTRTVSAWGPAVQRDLMRLRVGVIGCGSVGSMVAEALARTGVMRMTLLDFDGLENVNLDRTLHGTREDVAHHRSKVEVIANGLRKGATAEAFEVMPLEFSVLERDGFRAALDCDLLFSCVDRPWPRSALNGIAYAHLIPVIDGGILVTTRRDGTAIRGAEWRAHTVAPGRRCMECVGQYTPADATLEREGHLDDPHYIVGLPPEHRLRRNENVFAFSLSVASMELMQALALIVAPSGVSNIGAKLYHFVSGREDEPDFSNCDASCPFPSMVAAGDRSPVSWIAAHPVAERARDRRTQLRAQKHAPVGRSRAREWLKVLWSRLIGTDRSSPP